MIRRLTQPEPATAVEAAPDLDATTSIESWLAVFGRLLELPEPAKEAIRDELEQHLRERVRDLVLAGKNETEALRLAIDELGSAAELAHRFKIARRPEPGRLIMHTVIIGVGAASLVTAGMLVSSAVKGPGAQYYHPPAGADERARLADVPISIAFEATPLADVFAHFAGVVESDLVVYWPVLDECGITRERPVTITLERRRPMSQVIPLVLESAAQPGWPAVDWRYGDGLLEFSTREYFDRRESRLATFDVTAVLEALEPQLATSREAAIERLCGLIYEYVDPDAWQANGGRLAQLTVVGTTMLVRAPHRIHAEIEWILGQLGAPERAPVGDGAGFGGRGAGFGGGDGGAGGFGGGGGGGGGGAAGFGDDRGGTR